MSKGFAKWLVWGGVLLRAMAVASAADSGEVGPPDPRALDRPPGTMTVEGMCSQLRRAIASLKWKLEPCQGIDWTVAGASVQGRPLIYAEFGNPSVASNTTLILSSVHGDEITPIYVGFELVRWMKEHEAQFSKTHVVIAPLVNPDGFFRSPRTRMNARGVDVNRNFATRDWNSRALATWKKRLHSDPRRFPGPQARSEPETIFQEELIKRFQPQKILSIHAPLNHLDYDGPSIQSLARFPREYVHECLVLRKRLKAVSTGYFPGSLGNYAGQELGIPTVTLELPSADASKAERYWRNFSQGIKTLIEFVVPNYASRDSPIG